MSWQDRVESGASSAPPKHQAFSRMVRRNVAELPPPPNTTPPAEIRAVLASALRLGRLRPGGWTRGRPSPIVSGVTRVRQSVGRSPSSLWFTFLWLSTLFVSVLHAGGAQAATPEERSAAREAATAGIRAYKEGDYDRALELLPKAEQLVHAPPHLLYIARARVGKGELVLAREALLELVNEALPTNAPTAFRDAQSAGRTLLEEIEPKIGRLRIYVHGVEGEVSVDVDGKPVPSSLLGLPFPVDPGLRAVGAQAKYAPREEALVSVDEGASKEITLYLVEDIPPPAPTVAKKPAPPPKPAAQGQSPWAKIHPLTYVGTGLVLAGVATGVTTGLLSLMVTERNRITYCKDGICQPAAADGLARADLYANVANVAFGVAALGAGLVVYGLLAKRPGESEPTAKTASAVPDVAFDVSPFGGAAAATWKF